MTNGRRAPSLTDLASFELYRLDNPEWFDDGSARVLRGDPGSRYQPWRDEPSLFMRFAGLPDTEEAYARFAHSYGLLRYSAPARWYSERMENWVESRRRMGFAVRLWEALRCNSPEAVVGVDVFVRRLMDGNGVYLSEDGCHPTGAASMSGGPIPAGVFPEDPSVPVALIPADSCARDAVAAALRVVVNAQLADSRAHPSLASTGSPLGIGLHLTFAVEDLLGAMWLQFILAIDGNRDYQTCVGCNEPWDATGARATRDYCSEKCRQRIARRSKSEGGITNG